MPPQRVPRPSQEFVDYVKGLFAKRKAERGLTWSALACEIVVHNSLLTHFLKRKRGLRPDLLQKLGKALSPDPDEQENTRIFIFDFMRRAGHPMFPGFLELLTEVIEAPPDDFMKIIEKASPEERQQLREHLMFLRLRAEYQESRQSES